MLGLFGTLNLGARSLSTQQQGTEVAGHNLANVNNPAYSRQRLAIATSLSAGPRERKCGWPLGSFVFGMLRYTWSRGSAFVRHEYAVQLGLYRF